MSGNEVEEVPVSEQVEQKVDETSKRIWVGGLRLNMVEGAVGDNRGARIRTLKAAVSDLCAVYGRVKECRINGGGSFCVVTYESHEEAVLALEKIIEKPFRYCYKRQPPKAHWHQEREVEQDSEATPQPTKDTENKVPRKKREAQSLRFLTPKNHPTAAPVVMEKTAWDLPSQPAQPSGELTSNQQTSFSGQPRGQRSYSRGSSNAGRGGGRGRGRGGPYRQTYASAGADAPSAPATKEPRTAQTHPGQGYAKGKGGPPKYTKARVPEGAYHVEVQRSGTVLVSFYVSEEVYKSHIAALVPN
jgi:hypothetical protein